MKLLNRTHLSCVFLLLAAICPVMSFAEEEDPALARGNRLVKTYLVSDLTALQPARNEDTPSARIGVRFVVEPGWHVYWKNSGESGVPTTVNFHVPEDWRTSAPRFPAPYKYIEKGDILTFGYETETLIISDIYAPLVIPEHDAPITIRADVNWLVCKDSCVPGGRQVELTLPFGTESPLEGSRSYDMFQRFDAQTPQSLARLRQVK